MINLLCFLCSLCIQFVAIDLPYNFSTVNTNNYTIVTTLWEDLVGRGYNVDPDYMIVVYRPNQSRLYYVYYPNEPFNQQQSTISLSNRIESTGTINVSMSNWRRFTFTNLNTFYNMTENSSLGSSTFQLDDGSSWGSSTNIIIWNARYSLPYDNLDTFNWQNEVLPIGSGSGSLGVGGHSAGGSPIDELNSNGVTWSSTQGNFTSTGHSIQNVTTPPAADPNSNLELILSGFLGGILNNTNDILGNTSQLGSVLGGVSNNIIQGSSAIFNAISNLNNTIMDLVNYIREPLDQERISAKLEEVPIYQTVNSLVGFSDSFLSAINSIQDPDHLYLTMDFRNANEPFRRLGLYVFDFTFLDDLKSTWQPILIAILYVTLGVNIFYDLPNIIHGISGLSGGDE